MRSVLASSATDHGIRALTSSHLSSEAAFSASRTSAGVSTSSRAYRMFGVADACRAATALSLFGALVLLAKVGQAQVGRRTHSG
jgi:hypothetical protein